jgi:hypothetical protein
MKKAAAIGLTTALAVLGSTAASEARDNNRTGGGEHVNVATIEGVDPTGARDSSGAISAAIKSGARQLSFPCGRFLIAQTILLPSGSQVTGRGECSILATSKSIQGNPQWASLNVAYPKGMPAGVFSNEDWKGGNANIEIRDLVLDGRAGTDGGRRIYLAAFVRTRDVVVRGVRFLGAENDDVQIGAAFLASRNFRITDNYASGERSACYGVWDGSHNFVISDNVCDGKGVSSGGVVVNGIGTNNEPERSTSALVARNVVRNTRDTGIFVGGLWNGNPDGPVYGGVEDAVVENNSVTNVSDYHGILISDGKNIVVRANRVANTAHQGIRVGSQFHGVTSQVVVEGNSIANAGVKDRNADAVRVTNGAESVSIRGNSVSGRTHRFGVRVDKDVRRATVSPGATTEGWMGGVSDSSRR